MIPGSNPNPFDRPDIDDPTLEDLDREWSRLDATAKADIDRQVTERTGQPISTADYREDAAERHAAILREIRIWRMART
jgi:hypothetical protein